MESDVLYELVVDAVRAALEEDHGGDRVRLHKRLVEGAVVFKDAEGKVVREVPAEQIFKKVTAVRERLRVIEQKLNNHPALSNEDRAELQGLITRAYGSLTTFNFMFRDEADKFQGMGS